jgi:hypothetical protein
MLTQRAEPPMLGWPPYGRMNKGFEFDIATKRVPPGFRIKGVPANDATFTKWVEDRVDDMAKFLWPRYATVPGKPGGTWTGKAADFAQDLTVSDLKLMRVLRGYLSSMPRGRNDKMTNSHRALFRAEDEGKPWPTYAQYETGWSPEMQTLVQESMHKPVAAFGPAPLRFKQLMQRPRPYQMALALGFDDFEYEWARSAVTPAIISGHCVQGVIAGAGAYVAHLYDLQNLPDAECFLQQYAVDIGDRRVFAGVHYPTDNVASWFVALHACDNNLFGELGQNARRFLWEAISKRSLVYAAMKDAGGLYKKPLNVLERLAAGSPADKASPS